MRAPTPVAVAVLAGVVALSGCTGDSARSVVPGGMRLAAESGRLVVDSGRPKAVRYLGYTFLVPSSWPVIDDARQAGSCVRFDQHAVYLGAVRSNQSCPSWLLGTTEAVLIQPGPARAPRSTAENQVARQITSRAPGIVVTATFDRNPLAIYRILASASLPVPAHRPRSTAADLVGLTTGARLSRRAPTLRGPMPAPALPAAVASFRGRGFDACAAPSQAYLRAWRRHSPYRAIGIYIGGADRACAQANLSQAWVRREAQAGWRFIPLYAGPQAAFGELRSPLSQGSAAAKDAVAQARRLGFGPRTPIYYDMEAYRPGSRTEALRFLAAWTAGLHELGYSSGVYSSSDSGIADLAQRYSQRGYPLPDVIYDALWNGSATTHDRNLAPSQWPHHRRIHQYRGNITQTYGGDTINVDKDYLDVRMSQAGGTAQATSAVALPDGSVDLFYRARRGRLVFERYRPATGWSRPVAESTGVWSVPSVVWTGSAIDVLYKGNGGYLWSESYRQDGTLTGRHRIAIMGVLGLGPRAIAEPGGVIDVFWRGSADDHLWHGQFTPGYGWTGPQGLGGDLVAAPSPVLSSPGTSSVFWKGRDGSLWMISRNLGGHWGAPSSLGMGPLGGAPQATAQPSGAIEVCWTGSGNSHLWEAFYQPHGGWRGPRDLGGTLRSAPWPVTGAGTVRVLWAGPRHRLTMLRHRSGSGWNATGWDRPRELNSQRLYSAPFAAAGQSGAVVRVFWWGRGGTLWTAALSAHGWTGAVRLPGSRLHADRAHRLAPVNGRDHGARPDPVGKPLGDLEE